MKSLKKIAVSFLVVLAMSCTMIGTWAADTNQITEYTVQTSEDGATWTDANINNIVISSAHMLRVNVTLQNAGEVTLMSYKNGAKTYDNSNIQYVSQETAGTDNSASIQFRPRESLGAGEYVIKIGGSGVTNPVSFSYVVIIAANSNILCDVPDDAKCADVATYSIAGITDTAVVKIDGTDLTIGTDYTISGDTLTIKPAAIRGKEFGPYALTVTDGDKTGYSTLNVCPAVKYQETKFGVSGSETPVTEVYATTIPDGAGGYKIPLKPYPSYLSKYDTKVTHTDGLFIGWQNTTGTKIYTVNSDGVYIPYTSDLSTLTAVYGEKDARLTQTGYQKIQYVDGKGDTHNAIRFVALVDLDLFGVTSDMTLDEKNAKIANIKAGFVVSDICSSPTKEGGFAFTDENYVYNSIKTRASLTDATNKDVAALETELGVDPGTYDCILTSVLNIDTEAQKSIEIGAVAYIEYTDANDVTHRVYGSKGSPMSFADLSQPSN